MHILLGLFFVAHGLVHLLYFAISRHMFELDNPIVGWPEESWLLARLLDEPTTRQLAGALYVLAALLFFVGGIGAVFSLFAWQPLATGASIFSIVIVLLFWNGKIRQLAGQGFVAVLIDLAILGGLYFFGDALLRAA